MPGAPASASLQARVLRQWQQRGPLACLLWPLAALLGLVVRARRGLYRLGWRQPEPLSAAVIVVGNVVAGGVGKTPVVMAVVEHLQRRGLTCGVVSRGHGRRRHDCREVTPDSDPHDVGDEPLLIRRRADCPVWVAPRRADAARALLRQHPGLQVIVSDDGLQHLALPRDVEICVFDDRGVGNGWLQPAGPLREPWPRPVDLVLHTGPHPAFDGYRGLRELAPHAHRADGTEIPLQALRSPHLHALAGIARPEVFFEQLRAQGLALASATALPDHYDFDSYKAPSDAGYRLVCTEKDAFKLWRSQPEAWAVPLRFSPEAAFWLDLDHRLAAALSSRPPAPRHP